MYRKHQFLLFLFSKTGNPQQHEQKLMFLINMNIINTYLFI